MRVSWKGWLLIASVALVGVGANLARSAFRAPSVSGLNSTPSANVVVPQESVSGITRLRDRLDRLETSVRADSSRSRAVSAEIGRFEARLSELEEKNATIESEPPPSQGNASERAEDMRAAFAEDRTQRDHASAAELRATINGSMERWPSLRGLTIESANCSPTWCIVEMSRAEGEPIADIFPEFVMSLGGFAAETSVAIDSEKQRVTVALSRPGHDLRRQAWE